MLILPTTKTSLVNLLLHLQALIFLSNLIPSSLARDFVVGDKHGWGLNPPESYSVWAGRHRFQIHDRIVFKYKKGEDSVLVVKKESFDSCNTTQPLEKLDGGDSVFELEKSGNFFFISGQEGNCEKGERLVVVVMADRRKQSPVITPSLSPEAAANGRAPAPAPAPVPAQPPSVNETLPALTGGSPAQPPSLEGSQSPGSPSSSSVLGVCFGVMGLAYFAHFLF